MAEEKKKDRGLWFREMKSELKKVVWPEKKTVLKNTGIVIGCSAAIGACIWVKWTPMGYSTTLFMFTSSLSLMVLISR